jgi:uncharacterized membrane protein
MYPQPNNSIEDIFTTAAEFAVFFFIFGMATFAIAIAYIIRLWLTQTAIFQLQKDVEKIKDHLLDLGVVNNVPERPKVIENESAKPLITKQKIELKRLGKFYVWLVVAIPVLLICLIITINVFS